MTDIEAITVHVEIVDEVAEREITKAITARHSIARRYVKWVRRWHPDATPAEVIQLIERHYGTSITAAGAVVAAGAIAADLGIGLIPGGGAAKDGAKFAAKEAVKVAAKKTALQGAKVGAKKAAGLLPAGDAQLQFEITAIFGLALADIHGMKLDQNQARALVYGLSNGRVSQQQIATMASDLAKASPEAGVGDHGNIAGGRADWSHWASTLANALPGNAAQSLVKTIQTGQLDDVRENLNGKRQAAIEYGVGALVGGVTRFVFGRDVIEAARAAFPQAPIAFPSHLHVPAKAKRGTLRTKAEPNRALAALEEAAKSTGMRIAGTANTVGGGVAAGAIAAGSGIASAADAAGKRVGILFKRRKRD